MVRNGVDFSITCPEKCTQDPACQADDDGTKEGRPKSVDMKSRDEGSYKLKEEGVNNKNEQPHRHQNERETQKEQERTNKGVDNPQKEGGSDKCKKRIRMDSANEKSCHKNG